MERERFNTVWDRDGSLKRLLGDEALLQKMLVMFQQSNTQTLSDISLAIEKDDFILVPPEMLHQFIAGENGMNMVCVVPNEGQPK